MYSHLQRRKNTLGALPSTEVVGGVQQFTQGSANALLAAAKNLYPVQTSNGYFPGNEPDVPAPTFDVSADFWGYFGQPASLFEAQGQQLPEQTVYQQIMSGGTVLVDLKSAEAVLAGSPVNLVYATSQNKTLADLYAQPGASLAVLSLATANSTKKKEDYTPLLIAAAGGGVGALIAGPIGAVVGAAAGYYVASA